MRNKRKILIGSIVLLLMFSIVATASNNIGTEQDPVVTVSYVELKINELKNYIDQKLLNNASTSEAKEEIITTDQPQTSATFEVIKLNKNQSLIGKDSTEIILRSGTATAIDNGINGISDLTEGKDLRSGDKIVCNHLLIVPRDDGRGILATSEIWVMVKGGYEIK